MRARRPSVVIALAAFGGAVASACFDWNIGTGSTNAATGVPGDGGDPDGDPALSALPQQACRGECLCGDNNSCHFLCPTGHCALACTDNAACRIDCAVGASCAIRCDVNAACELNCPPGAACEVACSDNASCDECADSGACR